MMKAMRKVDCQTTQEEAIRILQNLKYLSVAMLNEDGSPYNVVVDCVYDDGKIYFHSANEGQKLDCIRHDPRVCAVGYSGATSDAANSTTRYASVVIHGKAHILEDKERKLEIIRKEAAARGVTPEKIDATIAAYFDVMAMVEIEIEALTGKVTPWVPASVLQLHRDVTVIVSKNN